MVVEGMSRLRLFLFTLASISFTNQALASSSSSNTRVRTRVSSARDAYGPLRVDRSGQIRGDLVPFTCSGKNNDAGIIYGPEDYGCKGGSSNRLKISKRDWVDTGSGWVRFDGSLDQCMSFVRSSVYGDLQTPDLPCFRCYATVSEDGDCYLYSNCGRLGYTKGDQTALYCGFT
uniref:Uncharacterized protein n=1 Tax=Tetraselmis sp. GSL018 TaxID=582737 RepID=A0A061QW00_9CHLO|eukprot:CAMPEP_0177610012 /NCGR_PEP_ID=MMETSP0419_2-20121207/19493_1 /TAXON_ID=582737 /ORGANISM="Tetraselmis sp., Strain GSL018" /LENGTH=173 /DNA_ID=CAMNT_0019105171 /DNA_START=170 /DNA_END=691 /DNA_ORIENTATION=+